MKDIIIDQIIGHLGAAQGQRSVRDDAIIAAHIDDAMTAAKALRDKQAEEIVWLQSMLSDAVELLETGSSGLVAGCAEDIRWIDRCDKLLERHRERNK